MTNKALLQWHVDMGADEAIADQPRNYFEVKKPATGFAEETTPYQATPAEKPSPSTTQLAGSARAIADGLTSLAELEAAIRAFDGCALKKTASKTVFADGNPEARVLVIGEAPGADEDRQGIPFCGISGQLLDKMLATIGLVRSKNVFISNTVYWRPPGNRQPSKEETALCQPFVEKLIALMNPALLILAGGTAASAVLAREESISRLRGRQYPYENPYTAKPVTTMVTYHPSYLLRQPSQKRLAWQDMLAIQAFLQEQAIDI